MRQWAHSRASWSARWRADDGRRYNAEVRFLGAFHAVAHPHGGGRGGGAVSIDLSLPWQVIHGDCLDVMRSLPDGCVDAVVTDPPYGIDLQPQRGLTLAIAGDKPHEARPLREGLAREAARVARPDSAHLFFGRWSEVWAKDVLAAHFTVKGCIVWRKAQWGIGYYLRPQHELAWYCHKGKPPVPHEAQSDVWDAPRESAPVHSCQKPVPLMARAVRLCAGDGLVLDPFAGSGSTGVAAVQEGYRFLGIEREASYVEVARRRIADAAAQGNLFAEVG